MTALFIACGALAREVIALRDKHKWDVKILALPSVLHNSPEHIPDAVLEKIEAHHHNYDISLIIYGDCGTGGLLDKRLEQLGIERIAGPHCYEMYAGVAFHQMMEAIPGTFFLTDYLVQSFDHLVIENLGLDRFPELRDVYFGNYERLVYLQQRQDTKLLFQAVQAAQWLNLPLELRKTGYGALEKRLTAFMDKHSKLVG